MQLAERSRLAYLPQEMSDEPEVMFEYIGRRQIVPKDVVSVQFHPTVTKIDEYSLVAIV